MFDSDLDREQAHVGDMPHPELSGRARLGSNLQDMRRRAFLDDVACYARRLGLLAMEKARLLQAASAR